MNWFERYGIVGMSFFVFLAIFLYLFYGPEINFSKKEERENQVVLITNLKNRAYVMFDGVKTQITITKRKEYPIQIIGGMFIFSFLPIGYIIAIFSQALYYFINGRGRLAEFICRKTKQRGLHQKVLGKIPNNYLRRRIGLMENDSEENVEATLTYWDRMRIRDREGMQFIAPFITKRFDVIAINRAIQLSVILAFFLSFSGIFIVKLINVHWEGVILGGLIVFLLSRIFKLSSDKLEQQIIKIEEQIFILERFWG